MNILSKIKYLVEYYIICHGSSCKYWEYQGRELGRYMDKVMKEREKKWKGR